MDDSPIRPLNLSDVFARVYLARGCGFVVHDEGRGHKAVISCYDDQP